MQFLVLGSAAGGGFPQWNCGCVMCRTARESPEHAHPRRQSSLAVRSGTGPWYLLNASPDVREQLELIRDPSDRALRSNPIAGVILTDAEIDHSAGLLILRESGTPLEIHGTSAMRHQMTVGFPVLEVLKRYCGVRWHEIEPGREFSLSSDGEGTSGLRVEPFAVPADPPLYMRGRMAGGEWPAVGLTFHDPSTGTSATYVPGLAAIDDELMARFRASNAVFLDGTFWSDDELTSQGVGKRTATDMGHLPLSGAGGTIERLRDLTDTRKVLVHINNSNPILLEDSAERRAVEEAGFEVGYDGMSVEL